MANQVAPKQGLKCVDTQKLFFREFAYSFTVPFPTEQLSEICEARYKFDYNKALRLKLAMQRALLDRVYSYLPRKTETNYRINGASIIFYTNEQKAFDRLIKNHSDMLSKISRPKVDVAELAALDEHVLVRDKLWFDKYRVKITMHWLNDVTGLDALVEEQFDDGEVSYYNYGVQRVLYVKDVSNLMIARLKLDNYISRVEKIKLIEEFNHARTTAA